MPTFINKLPGGLSIDGAAGHTYHIDGSQSIEITDEDVAVMREMGAFKILEEQGHVVIEGVAEPTPEVKYGPDPESKQEPDPESKQEPDPESKQEPDPESKQAPDPESKQAPEAATEPNPESDPERPPRRRVRKPKPRGDAD